MSNEIATYSMILSKLSLGKSGTECPTKTQILAINSLIVIENASTYGANECVKIDDIRKKAETWNYYLTVSPTSMSFGAGGGTGDIGFTSYKLVNGNQISLGYSIDSSTLPSWATYSNGRFTISSNSSTSSRSANVYFTQSESGKTQSIKITQSGYTPTYTFNVTPTNLSVTAAETNETLTVNSYKTVLKSDGSETTESLNYEFSSNASWVNAARTTTNTTYITVAQNLTTNQRSAKITLTQAESGAQVFTNVIQAGQQVVDNKLTLTSITYSTGYLFPSGQTPVEGETVYLGFVVPNTFTWKTSNGLAINRGTIYAGNIGNIYVRKNDRYKLVKSFQLQTGDQTISF